MSGPGRERDRFAGTHDYIQETGDVSVRQGLEDFNLALEVLEELGGKLAPADGFYRDLLVSFLAGWFGLVRSAQATGIGTDRVVSLVNCGEGTLSDLRYYNIGLDLLVFFSRDCGRGAYHVWGGIGLRRWHPKSKGGGR